MADWLDEAIAEGGDAAIKVLIDYAEDIRRQHDLNKALDESVHMSLIDRTRAYAVMDTARLFHASVAKVLRERMNEVEEGLVDALTDEGLNRMDVAGRLVYTQSETWASVPPDNLDKVKDGLRAIGEGVLVKESINSRSLTSRVREWEEIDGIPPELVDLIKVSRKVRLRTKQAT